MHAELGSLADFDTLVADAARLGMEIALDYALQCSPDHPWVREHPEWFHHRPDGTIKYAENPPKKYQDIYPINFWPADDRDRVALWEACKRDPRLLDRPWRAHLPRRQPAHQAAGVLGVGDRRRTRQPPDVMFLAEAFTRPQMMAKLAEVGFSQSYTYFTWRTARDELRSTSKSSRRLHGRLHAAELLAEHTRHPLRPAARRPDRPRSRCALVLAATLVPSYGIYSGYELCENEPASDLNEEYLHSEKYEVKQRRTWTTHRSCR